MWRTRVSQSRKPKSRGIKTCSGKTRCSPFLLQSWAWWLQWRGKENGRKNRRECVGVHTIDFPLSCEQGFPAPYFPQVICSCVPFPECLLGTRCQASRCKVAASCSLFKLGVLFIHVVPSSFSPSLSVAFPSYGIPLSDTCSHCCPLLWCLHFHMCRPCVRPCSRAIPMHALPPHPHEFLKFISKSICFVW